eukprot:3241582-Pleurochrysis_carterae.AAC.1
MVCEVRRKAYMRNDKARGPRVSDGMPPPSKRVRAAFLLPGPLAKRHSGTLTAAAIPRVRMAKAKPLRNRACVCDIE